MADLTPKLVTPDGERKAPAMTYEQLYELLKPAAQTEAQQAALATTIAQAVATAVAQASVDAQTALFDKMSGDSKYGEWNISKFPDRSAFNPLGENETVGGLARPELDGMVFWVGTPMDTRENTREEIEWANKLTPGIFHNGQWKVVDLAPGQGKRALLVVFPCVEPDQRAALPGGYRDFSSGTARQVTGAEMMLREMVEEAAAQKAGRQAMAVA